MKHEVVNADEWEKAHAAFLEKEKAFIRAKDELSRSRLNLPWKKVEKNYTFEGSQGKRTLAELFEGKSQLILQHFMLAPGWEAGCEGCSFMADHIDGTLPHLNQKDVAYVAVSRAPIATIEKFKKRMGWTFPWYSSNGTDFNYDFHVSFTDGEKQKNEVYYNFSRQQYMGEEMPGVSSFYKDEKGQVFHTYSSYARGAEQVIATYSLLDIAPKGRNEEGFKVHPMEWVRHHDKYDEKNTKPDCCH